MWADESSSKDSKGIWLWSVFATIALFFIEFILFAAFIPSDWAATSAERETRWLVQTQGADSADAIIDRAERWYRAAFIDTGVAPWTYHMYAPDDDTPVEPGFEGVAENPIWDWTRGRLDVIWGSLAMALQRISLIISWLPFLTILLIAAVGDGWVRRRIRQHGFAYSSPLAHRVGVVGIALTWIIVALWLLMPFPVHALVLPLLCVITAVLLDLMVTHTQKRV